MSQRYGQSLIAWSTIAAPHPFSGTCTSYSYRDQKTRQLVDDEGGDNLALILHSRKADVEFEARVTVASTDFLDLSAGAAVVVSGITGGTLLARRVSEKWTLLQPKTISFSGTHYPDLTQASPVLAGVATTAFVPDQTGLGIVYPGTEIIYSTFGMTHASGTIHSLTLDQELQITEDEPTPDGLITGAASHGYMRAISLDLLSKAAAPAVGTVLALTGAPARAANYRIESVETKLTEKRGQMFALKAIWIPPFG